MNHTEQLENSLFLRACRQERVDRTPIWLMRQAGRYMKEYREVRTKTGFMELCKNSDLAAEVTVFAAEHLGVDAAIIFSDLLLILEPLGFQLSYAPNNGPLIANPLRESRDVDRIRQPDVHSSMGFVFAAIRKTRKSLKPDLPLIGFAGAPFTMAAYAIEGRGSKDFHRTQEFMHSEEKAWHVLMDLIVNATIPYLNGQIEAGAQAVQIFDSWVGNLTPKEYEEFVLPHTQKLIQGIKPRTPVISFGTRTAPFLPLLKKAGGDVIGIDSDITLDKAWSLLGDVAIMGNLNPKTLLTNNERIKAEAIQILDLAGGRPGHIFNLGHGILKETPVENVRYLVEVVKEYSAKLTSHPSQKI